MSQRTTIAKVQGVLADNWDGKTALQPFIDSAIVVVDRVYTCSVSKGLTLSTTELEMIERWLSAHFYCQFDPLFMSKTTGKASGAFQREAAVNGFETTDYGKAAVRVDYSGCLSAIGKRALASMAWLGTNPCGT